MHPCALALVLLVGAPPWQPEGKPPHEGDTAKRLRLHFDLEALHWLGSVKYPGTLAPAQIRHEAVGAFGYKRFALGAGVGWGFGEYVVLGARFDLSVFPDRAGVGSRQLSRGASLSPYVEILFARNRHVRRHTVIRVCSVRWERTQQVDIHLAGAEHQPRHLLGARAAGWIVDHTLEAALG